MEAEKILSKEDSDYSLITGTSESGSLYAISKERGGINLITESGETGSVDTQTRMSASHIHITENGPAGVIGFMDDGSLYKFQGLESWGKSYEGLWDIDSSDDMSRVCSVSQPVEGPGSAVCFEDGEKVWEEPLDEAVGLSISCGPKGGRIAVGAGHYHRNDQPLSQFGHPGVYFYEWGEKEWFEQTEVDVIGVAFDSKNDCVTAGLDDGSIISYSTNGSKLFRKNGALTASNVQWEAEDEGGFISISGDRTSIVSHILGSLRCINTQGDVHWEAEIEGMVLDERSIQVDETGDRVFITTMSGEAYLVEKGDILWKESYSVGPVRGSLSNDGTAWCLSIQNNDTGTNTFKAYQEV